MNTITKVPFLDVGYTYRSIRTEIDEAYHRVMDSGWYIKGPEVENFDKVFAEYCGTKESVGVGNGLDAIHVILKALDIQPGDEVIVPGHTFIATWLAVSHLGAIPVPVDADPKTMNIDVHQVEKHITEKTKAILIVHLYGLAVEMEELNAISKKHNIPIIEDAAQAIGAKWRGTAAGGLGLAGTFSFYPGKNLGAFGDGGSVTSNDAHILKKARTICNYGSEKKYYHSEKGINSRLDTLQAAFLTAKLKALPGWTKTRQEQANQYLENLKDVDGLTLPYVPEDCVPVWHLFVVRHEKREEIMRQLTDAGIGVQIHYPIPNHHAGAYEGEFDGLSLPITEEICRTCFSLPVGPHLTQNEITYVISTLKDICRNI